MQTMFTFVMRQQQGNVEFFVSVVLGFPFILFRTSIVCYVLFNGDTSASATWTSMLMLFQDSIWLTHCFSALNTTIANIILFAYDPEQQIQSLYGYAQDGVSIMRSDDRGLTWVVTNFIEYSNVWRKWLSSEVLHKINFILF